MNKGVSTTLEAIFLLSISSILIAIVLVSFYDVSSRVKNVSASEEAYSIASRIARDVYSLAVSNATYAKKELRIPHTIGGEQYTITLVNETHKLIVENKYVRVEVPLSPYLSIGGSQANSYMAYLVVNNGVVEVKNE
ncbi:hypothetical protein Asulf_01467 [Archaeoglobus sulfaticallidus PM70-1]|uniref:Uncharacterized protein n=1 Tax=Archaeoglobus sulfaticallidus PM70-1 TaxID=387631 RepID=N0BMG0_9EURY|nr:hypothetical protein [Archaeoglobus sulfaticallidus]AGK61450.1 hypothetical protein Asulf_01467 [Archaeoglobus sulfaticallidus PM70-1]